MPHLALWEKSVGWAASGIIFSLDQPASRPANVQMDCKYPQLSSDLTQTEIQPQLQPQPQPNPTPTQHQPITNPTQP